MGLDSIQRETELRRKLGECFHRIKQTNDRNEAAAQKENRDWTAEENQEWDRLNAEYDSVRKALDRVVRMKNLEDFRDMRPNETERRLFGLDPNEKIDGSGEDRDTGPRGTAEYRKAFETYIRRGKNALSGEEIRALQVGDAGEGGYLVPEELDSQIVRKLHARFIMRELSDVFTSSKETVKIATEDTEGTGGWTEEEGAYNESDESFSQITLGAHKGTRLIKVSEELLADAVLNLQAHLADKFDWSLGSLEESAYVNGDGNAKPTGIVQGSSEGKVAASGTAITGDELIEFYHSLTEPYRVNGTFILKDATALLVRKLKGEDNQYIWQPGLQAGQPDRLLGKPVRTSEYMPAPTTGQKAIIFGDISFYKIKDMADSRAFIRLNELYRTSGQIGFIGRVRTDGKLSLSEAVKHLKMG